MYFPAHLATGYVVGKGVGKWTGIPVAFFSHYVLDWCWNMLYHDEITVPMGLGMGVASALLMWFGREQWPSMLAATITDWERAYSAIAGLDWSGAHYHWTYFWGLPLLQNAWFSVAIQSGFAILAVWAVLRKRGVSVVSKLVVHYRARIRERKATLAHTPPTGKKATTYRVPAGLVSLMWASFRGWRS